MSPEDSTHLAGSKDATHTDPCGHRCACWWAGWDAGHVNGYDVGQREAALAAAEEAAAAALHALAAANVAAAADLTGRSHDNRRTAEAAGRERTRARLTRGGHAA